MITVDYLVDNILAFLEDGRWHDFFEITEKFKLLERDIDYIISFLTEFGLVDLNKDQNKVKISTSLHSFFQIINI